MLSGILWFAIPMGTAILAQGRISLLQRASGILRWDCIGPISVYDQDSPYRDLSVASSKIVQTVFSVESFFKKDFADLDALGM